MVARENQISAATIFARTNFVNVDGIQSNSLHRLVGCGHEAGTTCRYGLSAAKAASPPIKNKLVVAMPSPRERIQPLTPKLVRRDTTPVRNKIESSAIWGSVSNFDKLSSVGRLTARTAPNVMPSVTGKKATEAATAKNAAHLPARCSCAATSRVP